MTVADEDEADVLTDDSHTIVVIGGMVRGQVRAPQKSILELGEEDIAAYGASSVTDLIAALGPQTGTGRGRGGGMPVILLNGQRISSFREMRNLPPEAIRKMEVLPEEVALRYGFPANQRVINFILRDNFSSRSIQAEYNAPTRGGFAETEFGAGLFAVTKTSRFSLNVEANDASMLTERERGLLSTITPLAGDPDPASARSLTPDSRSLSITGTASRALGSTPGSGSISANGSITRSDSRALAGFNSVVLTAPGGASALRTFGSPLERTSRSVSIAGGGALNLPVGKWQMTATVDVARGNSETEITRRADTAALVAAAASGALALDGALPVPATGGWERARSRTSSLDSMATMSGTAFTLPAGDVSATVKAGYKRNGISSDDTRSGLDTTRLRRERVYSGVNLSLPIASRKDDVLAAIGDLALNLSAGADRLSDFGSLTDWSAGLTWAPTEKLGIQASYLVNQDAPTLSDLGNPLVQSFNVPVYDLSTGTTSLVTLIGGGNRNLVKEKQRDLKIGVSWQVPWVENASVMAEWFRNRSNNVTAPFPLLTPAIEAAFPGRAVRDGAGRLVSIDQRPVTLYQTTGERLRWGFNISGAIGKPATPAAAAGAPARSGSPRMGPRPGGSGGGGGAGGGPRAGGGGGRGMMGMMMGGNGQGRWNLSLFHTWRFSESVLVAPGGPLLDLLDGDALSGGGVARHSLELEGGGFYRGFGLRANGNWTAPTTLKASGLPGTSDLRFGGTFKLNLRLFADLGQQERLAKSAPFLQGFRVALVADNVFDSRQKVTDANGVTPLGYRKDYLDPRGRFLGIDIRKMF